MNAHDDSTHVAALGRVIRKRRITRRFSTRALAAVAGIGRRQLTLIERGEPEAQLFDALWALADALQVRLSVIFNEAERCADTLHITQRAIIIKLLDEEHPRPWTLPELQQASTDIEPHIIAEALALLAAANVALQEGEAIRASQCALRLDALGMVSI